MLETPVTYEQESQKRRDRRLAGPDRAVSQSADLHDIVLVVFWGALDSRATDERVRHCGPTIWA